MMRRLIPLLALALATLPLFGAAIPFPQEKSDLKPDPAIRFGTLPNGLRYAVRANKEPKDRASMRLLVEAGAVHEQDDQQGLAHFLEHMAFNGSTHYGPDELIKYFQRMGMNFGGDTNASTWYTRTLYLLELPDTKPATLAEGVKVFGDYAGGLLLKADEIDKERGIILSEKRSRDSVDYRTYRATLEFMLKGTVFEKRDVIGPAEVLQKAGRDRFVDYYDTWYRPDVMAVVVVGDIDPDAVVKQITETFTPLKARGPGRGQPDWGKVPTFTGTQPFYHYESEAAATSVSISTVTPYAKEPDTAANRLSELPRSLAHSMLNRRLAILAKKENAPFSSASVDVSEDYNFYRQTSMDVTCREDQWMAALAVGEQELRRALEHGFQPAELKEVVANFRNGLEQAVKTFPTRRSEGTANGIATALLERNVWTTPQTDLELYGPVLDKITVADCLKAMRETWSPKHRLVMVTGNAKVSGPDARATIASTFEKSQAVPVAAPATIEDIKWAYTDFGPAGKVAKREHVQDLDVHLIAFENGVRLNLKRTDFQANAINIGVRIGTGNLSEPVSQPGLALFASNTFTAGGLGKHSADDLRRVLAGKTVGAGFGVADDAFGISGRTNREDLVLQMQLIAARITDPGYRAEAERQIRKGIDQVYLSFAHTPEGPFNLEVARLLANGDQRFGFPPQAELMKRNLDETRAWLTPELSRGPIEIAIVGDLDVEATIAAVAQTLGALPKRSEKAPFTERRKVSFPATPFTKAYTVETEIPKGEIRLYWPTTDGLEITRTRRLNMLAAVFSDRLRVKVREELGEGYSPGAGSNASDLYPGYGYISAGVTVDPPNATKVADIIVEIANDLAAKGVTDEELERAKKPVLTSLRESARTNGYWLGSVLAQAQERPQALAWSRSRYEDNSSITAAELSALAKAYLPAARASRVTVVPQAKPAAKKDAE